MKNLDVECFVLFVFDITLVSKSHFLDVLDLLDLRSEKFIYFEYETKEQYQTDLLIYSSCDQTDLNIVILKRYLSTFPKGL